MSGLRILIIEPDIRQQSQLVEYFRSRAHTVTAVSEIKYAPSLAETTIDVVIGETIVIEYARMQRERGCKVPIVIVLTANHDSARYANYDNTARAILVKPSTPAAVTNTIAAQQAQL